MLKFFSSLVVSVLRSTQDRRTRYGEPRGEEFDFLSHPQIARMNARQLADLPFPRPCARLPKSS